MKGKHIYLLLGLSLILSFSLVQCGGRQSKVRELEWPPALTTAVEKAPTTAYCDLIKNSSRFANQIVRTEALFYKNLENEVFYNSACNDSRIWVEFDSAYVYSDDALKEKLEQVACFRQQRCEGRARITVVGRFEGPNQAGYGHLGC